MKNLFILCVVLILSACSNTADQIEQLLGVSADETASSCLEITATTSGFLTPTTVTTTFKRVELPADFDISTLTAEGLESVNDNVCNQ